jgi:hypothetical protein
MKPPIITVASSGDERGRRAWIESGPHVTRVPFACNVVAPSRYLIGRYRSTNITLLPRLISHCSSVAFELIAYQLLSRRASQDRFDPGCNIPERGKIDACVATNSL